ncbi:MAG: ferredoxin [Labilibaculum sp.]|nr:ferredoxin [Labilibaculum sp.]
MSIGKYYFEITRIEHFRDKCMACVCCVEIAPEFWKMNADDGRCDLIGSYRQANCYELKIFEDEIYKN